MHCKICISLLAFFGVCRADACDKYTGGIITYKTNDLVLGRHIIYLSDKITTQGETLNIEVSNQYIPKVCCNLFQLAHEVLYLTITSCNVNELQENFMKMNSDT